MKIVFTIIFFALCFFSYAQLPSLPFNLKNFKSADVTEEQLSEIVTYLDQNNTSDQQAYDLLRERGMDPIEAAQLRERLEKARNSNRLSNNDNNYNTAPTTETGNTNRGERRVYDTENNVKPVTNPKKIFGLEIFSNGVLSFEPDINIATPVGYIIGPDDEININIYGYQEANYSLKVGPEGDITIPYVGVMYVAGQTIERVTAKIKSKLSTSGYSNIKTGLTKVSVTIGRIRSIKVTVLGEVRSPGTYTLPSLATAFNALYLSGGPNDIGSMR
ncbi:MAG TPA: polysaccharide biosynthesis/export family protein, partial [Segetibacter sp.]|nr:polysaccharide biosynthesis/export family protein [Segetibacter sp.]